LHNATFRAKHCKFGLGVRHFTVGSSTIGPEARYRFFKIANLWVAQYLLVRLGVKYIQQKTTRRWFLVNLLVFHFVVIVHHFFMLVRMAVLHDHHHRSFDEHFDP
jgi:hypothetical protein